MICALRGRLFREVESATRAEWPDYAIHLDDPHPLCTYADFMRTAYAGLGDLIVVEGDSIPPPGSIRRLLDCPQPWCVHPSWVGDRYLDNTLGLARFSLDLQRRYPYLFDEALTKPATMTQAWNRGLTDFKPRARLGVVPVDESVLRVWPELAQRAESRAHHPGTTAHPKAIDMRLAYELTKLHIAPHVHQPPAVHLRYTSDPGLGPRLLVSVLASPGHRK